MFFQENKNAWDARDALGYILDCTLKDLVTRPGPLFRCDPIWGCYIQGDKSDKEKKSTLSIISCVKAQKYMEKGCQQFLAQVTVKENKDESKEKRLEDLPTVLDFPEFFPEDLPGLPPIRQFEF
ncbi:hypothetical protein Tco_1525425 [Tanacetum coccineum]